MPSREHSSSHHSKNNPPNHLQDFLHSRVSIYTQLISRMENIDHVVSVQDGIHTITIHQNPEIHGQIKKMALDVGLIIERIDELVLPLVRFAGYELHPPDAEDPNGPIVLTRNPNDPERSDHFNRFEDFS